MLQFVAYLPCYIKYNQWIIQIASVLCSMQRGNIDQKSVIDMHTYSVKYTSGKLMLLQQKKREMTIAKALKSYESAHHALGESLSDSTRISV